MRILLKICVCFFLLFTLTTGNVQGKPPEVIVALTDSVYRIELLFPLDSSVIDPAFMDNPRNLKELDELIASIEAASKLNSITISASSSPDGSFSHNRLLAQHRANSMKSYLLERFPHIDGSLIRVNADYGYWDGLTELVRQDRNVPGRKELLEMLQTPGLTDDEKSSGMKTMNEGATFTYLRDQLILHRLRAVSAVIRFQPPLSLPVSEPAPEPEPLPEPAPERRSESGPEPKLPAIVWQDHVVCPLALRTNLLLDMIGGPNIGIEVPIGDRFSVAGDFAWAHTHIDNRFAFQTIQGSIEGRYWFRQRRNVLTGWNIGLYGTYSGRFDFQWNSGRQGDEYWSAGLSGGYAVPLSDSFNIDFSVMGGFLHSPEIRYYNKPRDGHLMWKETKYNVSRFKLTQIRVNLVWLLKSNKKVAK